MLCLSLFVFVLKKLNPYYFSCLLAKSSLTTKLCRCSDQNGESDILLSIREHTQGTLSYHGHHQDTNIQEPQRAACEEDMPHSGGSESHPCPMAE